MAPPEDRETIASKLASTADHISTGILGTAYMLDALSQSGRGQTVYNLVTGRNKSGEPVPDNVGWKNMLDHGATTLWEHWGGSDNTFSNNHPMFGSVSQWMFQWVGGIAPSPQANAFDRFEVHPLVTLDHVQSAACKIQTVRGEIVCSWRRVAAEGAARPSSVVVDLSVPVGARAVFRLDLAGLTSVRGATESGVPIQNARGLKLTWTGQGMAKGEIELSSGSYHFRFPLSESK